MSLLVPKGVLLLSLKIAAVDSPGETKEKQGASPPQPQQCPVVTWIQQILQLGWMSEQWLCPSDHDSIDHFSWKARKLLLAGTEAINPPCPGSLFESGICTPTSQGCCGMKWDKEHFSVLEVSRMIQVQESGSPPDQCSKNSRSTGTVREGAPRLLETALHFSDKSSRTWRKANCRGSGSFPHPPGPCFLGSTKESEPVSDFANTHYVPSYTLAWRFLSGRNANIFGSVEKISPKIIPVLTSTSVVSSPASHSNFKKCV